MKAILSTAIFAALTLVSALPCLAQQKRLSPHETISQTFGGRDNRVVIVYGRPYTKDPHTGAMRKIWGTLVPYDQVWRTGADEATLLCLEKPIVIGGTNLPAGAYSLYTIPHADGTAQLIINSQVGQWGLTYDQKLDVARVDLTRTALDTPVDQITIALARNPSGGGILQLQWENTQYSVAFTIAK